MHTYTYVDSCVQLKPGFCRLQPVYSCVTGSVIERKFEHRLNRAMSQSVAMLHSPPSLFYECEKHGEHGRVRRVVCRHDGRHGAHDTHDGAGLRGQPTEHAQMDLVHQGIGSIGLGQAMMEGNNYKHSTCDM
jgi:hypothetical protein